MDKSVESRFTSEFWRDINENHFIAQYQQQSLYSLIFPVYPKQTHDLANQPSLKIQKLIHEILEQYTPKNSLNDRNLRDRLHLLLAERMESENEVEELLNQMVDSICENTLHNGLQEAQNCIKNIGNLNEIEQEQHYLEEQKILHQIDYQISLSDEIQDKIAQLKLDLVQCKNNNIFDLDRLDDHIPEINRSIIFNYNMEIQGFSIKISRIRVTNHIMEMNVLKEFIIYIQNQQVAEGIGKAIFNTASNMVIVNLDKYLSINSIEFSLDDFTNLQRLREVPFELIDSNGLRSDSCEQQMCHFCRQMSDAKYMRQCQYNHTLMRLHEYNDDLLVEQRYRLSQEQLTEYLQDLYSANYVIENGQIQCKRYFCNKCLKYEFDTNVETQSYTWVCPLCKGLCTCIRCVRNDTIYKLKRSYLELGGSLKDIYQNSYFEQLVNEKRIQIRAINIDLSCKKIEQEAENTQPLLKGSSKKQIVSRRKKKCGSTTKIHKLHHIESSSSSMKIRRNKEINNLVGNDYPVEFLLHS